MNIKPQDVLVCLKLLASGWPGTFSKLGQELGLSASEAHAAMRRAQQSGLIHPLGDQPNKSALAEFLLHGLRYVFPVQPGPSTRGMPTGHAAPPLSHEFAASEQNDIPVWPDPQGTHRGYECKPLCRSVPVAARNDPKVYEWLVLVDALRGGRARERELAAKIVKQRLGG
jgi:hypothetical protein